MLRQIIKRDGSIEEVIPHKVNNWGMWGEKGLEGRVDWSSVVLEAFKNLPEISHSQNLQKELISILLNKRDWASNLFAGKLYAATYRKELYGSSIPTVKELFLKLERVGLMKFLDYSEDDYLVMEKMIDHSKDFKLAHFQLLHIRKKYALQNRITKDEYETPQFTYMRMAAALSVDEPKETRLIDVKNYYDLLSDNIINAPSPNYINLGTNQNGYASCNLYTVNDTARSLAIGDHIAYTMTYMSAGIGSHLNTRSVDDPVKNGFIQHQGKLPYYRSMAKAVKANLQAGRGGACATYYSAFDPEYSKITMLQNPLSTESNSNADIHFAAQFNKLLGEKAARNEDVFVFNSFTAPDLQQALFNGDVNKFKEVYLKYENDTSFKKTYVSARKLVLLAMEQGHEVSTLHLMFVDEANRHTPHKDTIYSSNLCLEIFEPTAAYENMMDLYSTEDHGRGEVALCSLAGICEPNVKTDEQYYLACYYSLKMIDKCIHISDYELPHIGFTAKQRMNAGIGLLGVATTLAKENIKYSTLEGRNKLHEIAERHAYFCISASLQLGKEKGNAPWMHKTKWPDGWLPLDTYKKTVDELVTVENKYGWETLRQEIIQNKGIRNSSLIAHMPTESSSKAAGVPNGIYPIRDLNLKKSDSGNVIDWCPVDGDLIGDQYELAFDIDSIALIKAFSVVQKWTDQGISADSYENRIKKPVISSKEMLDQFLAMIKYGYKSRYYQNSLVGNKKTITEIVKDKISVSVTSQESEERGCPSGSCSL